MSFFEKLLGTAPAVVSAEPRVPLSPEGGQHHLYSVAGVWHDGEFVVPERLVVTLSGGRETEKPGDTLMLTRREAEVLGQSVVLTLVGS